MSKRKIICIVELDETIPINAGVGDLDYLEDFFAFEHKSGIDLIDSRILDDDDPEDAEAIEMAEKIFEGTDNG